MKAEKIKKEIASTFNQVARRYDKNRFFQISADAMVKDISSSMVQRVLDLSTGTGFVAISLAKRFPHVAVEAIDISSGMLERAESKANTAGLKNIRFTRMDVEKLSYADSHFDLITCGYGMFFYPNMEATFKLIFTKLKKNGCLAFSTFRKYAFAPYAELFLELLPKYGVEVPEVSRKHLDTEEQIRDLCRVVEADRILLRTKKIRYAISIDDWWSLLNSAGYKGVLNRVPDDKKDEFKREHLSQASAHSKGGMLSLNADSLFTTIVK